MASGGSWCPLLPARSGACILSSGSRLPLRWGTPTASSSSGREGRPFTSGMPLPQPVSDMFNHHNPPFIGWYQLRDQENLFGIPARIKEYSYLLDPVEYRSHHETIPRGLRNFTLDPDDDVWTTYAVNFNAVVDCHVDTQDRGWVWEYVVGHYNPTHCLCFPSLGLKIQCPSGMIFGHKAGLVEHYAEDYGSEDDP
ncbi:hypothetical protein HDU88_005673 [Geranomyces variabilis]|nr:hypothetical protein HDU88_005673 [Geranomyces variabilis]